MEEFVWNKNSTELWPIFASDSILVRREVEAFSIGSLIAECGGILGLFLGFNFLLTWRWTLNCLINLVNKFSKIIN